MDKSYVHQPRSSNQYAQDWEQEQPWGQRWRSGSASPRQRVQPPRRRPKQRTGGDTPRGKSQGRGQHTNKGKGKGDLQQAQQVPLPPLPPPAMPWPGYMPMMMPGQMQFAAPMQSMQMPGGASTTTPAASGSMMTPEQLAREQKMQELMNYLKRRGPDLPQDVSQKVHEFTKKDGVQAKKDLQTAAKALGEAKDALEAALYKQGPTSSPPGIHF